MKFFTCCLGSAVLLLAGCASYEELADFPPPGHPARADSPTAPAPGSSESPAAGNSMSTLSLDIEPTALAATQAPDIDPQPIPEGAGEMMMNMKDGGMDHDSMQNMQEDGDMKNDAMEGMNHEGMKQDDSSATPPEKNTMNHGQMQHNKTEGGGK